MGSAPDGIVPPAAASIGIAAAADEFPDQGVLGHQGRVQGLTGGIFSMKQNSEKILSQRVLFKMKFGR